MALRVTIYALVCSILSHLLRGILAEESATNYNLWTMTCKQTVVNSTTELSYTLRVPQGTTGATTLQTMSQEPRHMRAVHVFAGTHGRSCDFRWPEFTTPAPLVPDYVTFLTTSDCLTPEQRVLGALKEFGERRSLKRVLFVVNCASDQLKKDCQAYIDGLKADASKSVLWSKVDSTWQDPMKLMGAGAQVDCRIRNDTGLNKGTMGQNGNTGQTNGQSTTENGSNNGNMLNSFSKTSVLFVSVSFIILMVISLAWLVFYYVQRFRYAHAKDRLARRLFNAAKKALTKIPSKSLRTGDKELDSDCPVCIEPYRPGDVIRTLPCKHVFHKTCVDPWLLEHRTCPMCKMDILKAFGYQFSRSEDSVHNLDGEDHFSSHGISTEGQISFPMPVGANESDIHDPFFPSPAPSPSLLQPVLHQSGAAGFNIIPLTVHGNNTDLRHFSADSSDSDSTPGCESRPVVPVQTGPTGVAARRLSNQQRPASTSAEIHHALHRSASQRSSLNSVGSNGGVNAEPAPRPSRSIPSMAAPRGAPLMLDAGDPVDPPQSPRGPPLSSRRLSPAQSIESL